MENVLHWFNMVKAKYSQVKLDNVGLSRKLVESRLNLKKNSEIEDKNKEFTQK